MRHPTDGTLRRLLDEPSGVPDAARSHVLTCPTCQASMEAARADATAVINLLSPEISDIGMQGADLDAAWQRLARASAVSSATVAEAPGTDAPGMGASGTGAPGTDAPGMGARGMGASGTGAPGVGAPGTGAPGTGAPGTGAPRVDASGIGRPRGVLRRLRWRAGVRSPVVAGAAVAVLLVGAGAAAAANWLPIFQTRQVAPLVVVPTDLVQLPELSGYGTLQVHTAPRIRTVENAAAAREVAGMPLPYVAALPDGVTGEASYRVGDKATATFTFSAAVAARTAAAEGKTLPPMPPGLDGSQFRLSAGPGVAAIWDEARGMPALIVARAAAPTAYSGGVSFEIARDYLLSLPGLPASVASQLRAFSGDGTLPLIVKAGEETSYTADVGGRTATVLATRDGAMAAVIWADQGMITGVAGTLSAEELLTVARGLTWR